MTGISTEIELSSLLAANGGDGSAGLVLNGVDADENSGRVNALGDINADGIDDLIIEARWASPGGRSQAGRHYVVFGTTAGFAPEFELSTLLAANGGDGSLGFVLNGIDTTDFSSGGTAAGDVNGDGIGDLIIGSSADPGDRFLAGQSYVVFGSATGFAAELELSSLLAANGGDGSAGFAINGIEISDRAEVVSAAGDVNGDGIDDVLIGATYASPGGREAAGQGYVVFGTAAGFPAEIELSALLEANGGDGSVGFALNGIDVADTADFVSAAGDVNADGIGDVLIGASGADPGGRDWAGETYVVFGQAPGSFAAEFELSELLADNGGDGSAGFVLNGISEDNATYGVRNAGDINADGIDDITILGEDETYVVFGCAGYPGTAPVPALLYPADGATDVSPIQKLYWEQTSPAWGHTIELATDPGFMEVVYRARSRSDSGHLFPVLAGATQYYWRVIANDACRFAVSDVRTFTTAEKPCQSHAATDLPLVTIPRSTVTSSVVVPEMPPLIDVNLLDVNGVHTYMGHLTFILRSPAGTDQWLYRRTCAGNDGFAFSLDDEATTPIPCPPIGGGTHQPQNPLIVYRDEIPTGTWELSIEDIGVLGTGAGGGTLLEWKLETCWTPAEPVIFDADGDGIEEDADNCAGVANPGQCNSDGDRFGNHCDADFDNNGIVNSFDLSILRTNFGVSEPAPYNVADLDCNGIVNSFDLSILRGRFGTAPGPSGLP